MFLFLNDEQTALQKSVGGLLGARSSSRAARPPTESVEGAERELWAELARLGVLEGSDPTLWEEGTHVPLELAVIQFEVGRHLYSGPLLSSALAGVALSTANPSGSSTLEKIRSGSLTCALGLPPRPGDAPLTLQDLGEGHMQLSGTVLALDAPDSQLLIAASHLGATPVYVMVPLDQVERPARLPSIDSTRSIGRIELDRARATVLSPVGGTSGASTFAAVIHTLVAAELAGIARAVLDRTVEHVKTRTQFGRPLGSFQAVKHQCVDMYTAVESSWSAVMYAGSPWHGNNEDFELAALTAYSTACHVVPTAVATAIQLHGAIGFTEEFELQLYLKRAKFLALLLGDPGAHLDAITDRILTFDQGPQ